MGAREFTTGVVSADTLAQAYTKEVAEARAEFGSDGYNGTISTTSGCRQVVQLAITAAGASLYAAAHCDDASKRGEALAVPVADDEHFTFKTVKLNVTVDPVDESGRPRTIRESDVREAAIDKAMREHGCAIHNVEVEAKIKTRTIVTSATGRAVTKYEVAGGYTRGQLFDTKAQAVTAAKKIVSSGYSNDKISIRAVKFYAETNSTDAAVIRTETVEAKGVATVTLAAPKKPHSGPVAGWIFFGIAAC